MRRAQIQQVFIYIMTIIVIGFILLIGVRSYIKIQKTSCDAEKITFIRELNKVLTENTVWGRESTEKVRRPCEYEVVCFADARSILNFKTISTITPTTFNYPTSAMIKNIISNSVQYGVNQTIFLANRKSVEPIGFNEMVVLQDPATPGIPEFALCVQSSSGYFNFKLSGKGNAVLVESP
ncbi:MAG: hypothetical protein V1743_03115 [Nanoarchaeota archaeon]